MNLLWVGFLNSDYHDWRGAGQSEDRLQKDQWLTEFLSAWHLTAPVPPVPADLEALHELRSLLLRLTEGLVAGSLPGEGDRERLNQVMRAGPVAPRLLPGESGLRLDLVPLDSGWAQVMAEVAASFARTLTEGETARVRICDNPDCRWVFYDETRNRAKRFCSDKECGNLLKVRRFRARQKETGGIEPGLEPNL